MRILVVEDEPALATLIVHGLAAEAFTCDVAHDGRDALWLASSGAYSAIVLDLLLPSMNGFNVCRALRDSENWTPVLILTAKDGDYDLVEALDCGADDFMSKPFSFVVLAARLRALIRRGHVPRPNVLVAGRLELDPFTRRCTIDDTVVELTPRESAILTAIAKRFPGVAVRQDIIDEVWGPEHEGDPNIIDVYVSHLRRKIGRVTPDRLIGNVRGVGFRIESR